MSRIRGTDTTPEKRVRSLLHGMGYRFRLHVRIPVVETGSRRKAQETQNNPPTRLSVACSPSSAEKSSRKKAAEMFRRRFITPDMVLPKHRLAIFVHGCFWHRHRGCKNCTTPSTRRDWWLAKLNGNAARDQLQQRLLRRLGWRVLVIWECETEKPQRFERVAKRVQQLLTRPSGRNDCHKKAQEAQKGFRCSE